MRRAAGVAGLCDVEGRAGGSVDVLGGLGCELVISLGLVGGRCRLGLGSRWGSRAPTQATEFAGNEMLEEMMRRRRLF